jgi:hypothetical protein
VAAAVLAALTAGCSLAQQAAPASLGSAPKDWPTLQDHAYGFSLRYPTGWTEQFDQPAGFHALSSRRDLTNLLELGDSDYWLVAQASPRDPTAGCGAPGEGTVDHGSTMGGLPATRYLITGSQGGATQHIIDVIAERGSTCFTLQIVAGGGIPLEREQSTLQVIQASYRLGP